MSFSLRYAAALLLVLFGLTISISAQTTRKTPRGTITGRITIKDKPAAGVIVGARKSSRANFFEMKKVSKAVTDHDGYYRITNLAPESYEVIPSAPAFVVSGSNPAKSKVVIISEDETIDNINFTLVRGGVITGKVIDADNRPVIQQQVQLYRYDAMVSTPEPRPDFSGINATTDDRGIYRMFGLPAGRYKVAAGRGEQGYSTHDNTGRSSYKQVFHPDVTDQAKATIIDVAEGSEVTNVDITVGRALQMFSASGSVVNEKGSPVPGLRFGLQRTAEGRMEFITSMIMSDDRGEFMIEGLLPGKYTVFSYPEQGENAYIQTPTFDIIDQDVTGITIKLSKGASVSGVIALEGGDKTVFDKLIKLQVRGFVSVGTGFGGMNSSPISPDGSFRLVGLPAGTLNIMLGSMMHPMNSDNFSVMRMERDGVVVPGIEIKEGENVTGLRLVVAYGVATVRGVVKVENGTLPEGSMLYVQLSKPSENNKFSGQTGVDARGRFVMEKVPSGAYQITAFVIGQNRELLKSVKQDVTVQEGTATEIVITIDLSDPQRP